MALQIATLGRIVPRQPLVVNLLRSYWSSSIHFTEDRGGEGDNQVKVIHLVMDSKLKLKLRLKLKSNPQVILWMSSESKSKFEQLWPMHTISLLRKLPL